MSIEKTIEAHTAAITNGSLALAAAINQLAEAVRFSQGQPGCAVKEKTKPAANETDSGEAPAAKEKAKPAAKEKAKPAAKEKTLSCTRDDVKQAAIRLASAKGKTVVVDLLSEYGAKTITQVDEEDFLALSAKLRQALEE
jgi:hypothetical protein